MNLSKKLVLTALIPMLIILCSGGLAIWQNNKILKEFEVVSDTYDTNTPKALEMQVDFKEQIHQWKDVLLRGNKPDDLAKHWAEFLRLEEKIDMEGADLAIRLGKSEAAPGIQDFLVMHKKLGESYRKSLGIFMGSGNDRFQADSIIRGIDKKPSETLRMAIDQIARESRALSRKAMNDALHTAILNFSGMFFTLLIASILFRYSLKRNVLVPIELMSIFARKFGSGDHSHRINLKSADELGMLAEAFNLASEKIESLVANLETSKMRYHNLIQEIDAIIWELNPKTNRYTFVSQRAEELLGYPLALWHGEAGFLERHSHPDDLAICQEKILETLEGAGSAEYTSRAITADGAIVWLNNRIKVIRDGQSNAVSILGVMLDITKMKQYEDRMAYLSSYDELTGLANRTLLADRLKHAISRVQAKGANNMSALMLINLDRFKLINESLGHQFGNEVIKSIAHRLQKIIGTDDTLAYLGADEFAIVLQDIGKPEEAAEIAKAVLYRVALPMEIEGNSLVANCSIGISIYPKDGSDPGAMLKNADSALTSVKRAGKNSFKFYTEEMNALAFASLRLENKLRSAIENREFVLFYQPQVNIYDNRIIGVEALIRWFPPGEPMVPPASFIPLAEETGLILPIGEWVLREACRQNKAWQDLGFAPFCVAVNLSAQQFCQPGIIELVAQVLDETGLDPRYLELEITESVMMDDVELVIKNLEALHGLGIKLAIDDFGTGYSSLNYLKRFRIDKLKVDKSFVQDIAVGSEDEAIVAAIIAMAHILKLTVIAEGVETETQLQYLRDKKCDEVQGYFFSKPLAADLLESYLSSGLFALHKESTCSDASPVAPPSSIVPPDRAKHETVLGGIVDEIAEQWHSDMARRHHHEVSYAT